MNIFEDLALKKWQYIHKRSRTLLYAHLLWEGCSHHYNADLPIPYAVSVLYLNQEIGVPLDEWEEMNHVLKDAQKKDHYFLLKLLRESYILHDQIDEFCQQVRKEDLSKVNKEWLGERWQIYRDLMYKFGSYLVLPLFIETDMEEELKLAINRKFPDSERSTVFQALTTPVKMSTGQEEELSLLKMAVLLEKGKSLENEVSFHLEKFGWIKNTAFNASFYSREEIIKAISSYGERQPEKLLQESRKKFSDIVQRIKEYSARLKDDVSTGILIDTLQESVYFRTWRTERYYRSAYLLHSFFERIAQLLGLSIEEFFYLSAEEIAHGLKNQPLPSSKIIEERMKGYGMWMPRHSKECIFSGSDLLKAEELIHLLPLHDGTTITGQCAYPGTVRGKVRVINNKSDIHTVEVGEVLVTPSTTPDFTPVLKRVAAIITDEGGVLSHASVISRELHIPCVIGTRSASRTLQTGNEVEVLANQGAVRILSA